MQIGQSLIFLSEFFLQEIGTKNSSDGKSSFFGADFFEPYPCILG
jgi:hypothetical protein